MSGSPNTATAPSIMIEASQASAPTTAPVKAVANIAPPMPDAFTAFFSQISSQLSSIGSQLEPLATKVKATNTRVDRLERPKPYSPPQLSRGALPLLWQILPYANTCPLPLSTTTTSGQTPSNTRKSPRCAP